MATTVIITSVTMDNNSYLTVTGTVNAKVVSVGVPLSVLVGFPSIAMIQNYLALALCGNSGVTSTAIAALTGTVTL